MSEDTTGAGAGSRSSRTWLWIASTAAVLVVAYYGTMHFIRQHVTGLIKASEQRPLPAFQLQDLQGNTWSADKLKGKTVVLNFFRSRCPNCSREAPVIKLLASQIDSGSIVLLGIMIDKVLGFPASETKATLAKYGYRHPVLMADDAFVDAFHKVGWAHVTPVTYVVNPEGTITHALRGQQTLADLEAALR